MSLRRDMLDVVAWLSVREGGHIMLLVEPQHTSLLVHRDPGRGDDWWLLAENLREDALAAIDALGGWRDVGDERTIICPSDMLSAHERMAGWRRVQAAMGAESGHET